MPAELVRIEVDVFTAPFWEAARRHRLTFPRCRYCQRFRWPPTPVCPGCRLAEVDWIEARGDAQVFSYTVLHGLPGSPELLLIPVVVQFPDVPGIRFVSTLLDADPSDVHVEARVAVSYVPTASDWQWPAFRLSPSGDDRR
jgi:uncharacterized protein